MNDLSLLENKPVRKLKDIVILTLQHGYAHDLIDENEFEKRINDATNSDDRNALVALVKDLPLVEGEKSGKPSIKYEPGDLIINDGHVKDYKTVLTILSGVEKKGMWKPPKRLNVFTVMGGTDLDFSRAALNPGTTKIKVTCIMGGVDIIVPRGVNVEVSGIPIMGGMNNKTDETFNPGAPTLKIRALVVMGGVDIKYPKKRNKN